MGRMMKPVGVKRQGGKLIAELDDAVAIPQLNVLMSGVRAVMQIGGVIMGDADDVAGKFIAPGGLTTDPAAATNIRGLTGQTGQGGDAGAPAWTPMLAIESDGTARYLKVTDWTGGSGAKPATGYIGAGGIVTKANAPNLNVAKRFGIFSAVSNAQGVAAVSFGAAFEGAAAAPNIGHFGIPATAVGGVRTSIVAGMLSKAGVQIKVEAPSLLGTILTTLAGATVFIFAAEQ